MVYGIRKQILPGLLLCAAMGAAAWWLGTLAPVAGGSVIGLVLGILLSGARRPAALEEGVKWAGKYLLRLSVVLLGFGMNIASVARVGSQSILVLLAVVGAAFLLAVPLGRALGISGHTSLLIGAGTAICGGSAIAAAASVLSAREKDVAYSLSTIFVYNTLAVFLFPALGRLLGLSDAAFGVWAGSAINDTSSVVAAGYTFSAAAGEIATIVKLTRTLLIIPVVLLLAVYQSAHAKGQKRQSLAKVFPWFVLGFVAAAVVNTLGILPAVCAWLAGAAKVLIVVCMCAIGLGIKPKQLLVSGWRPLLLGLCCWVGVAAVSLLVLNATGMV